MACLAPFHPAVRARFASRLGEPTPPQREGWPLIREGRDVPIAAPSGSGETLAALLSAIDSLLRPGPDLAPSGPLAAGPQRGNRDRDPGLLFSPKVTPARWPTSRPLPSGQVRNSAGSPSGSSSRDAK